MKEAGRGSGASYTTPRFCCPKLGGVVVSRLPLTAADLPPLMEVPDPRGSYRFPLLQFIVDWNRSDNLEGLVVDRVALTIRRCLPPIPRTDQPSPKLDESAIDTVEAQPFPSGPRPRIAQETETFGLTSGAAYDPEDLALRSWSGFR